jgi:hypothetical protein
MAIAAPARTRPLGPQLAIRWAWERPLVAHAAALALVLGLLLVIGRPLVVFNADEGVALIQARQLAHGDGWLLDDAAPRAVRPLGGGTLSADEGAKGRAAYAKHPLYPVVLAGSELVAGDAGPLALSVAGVLMAAVAAAALATRLREDLGRPTLWAVALASPLWFDSGLVTAMTLGAGVAGALAVVVASTVLDGPSARRLVTGALGAGGLAALLVGLRSEGLLVALGIAVGSVATAGVGDRRRRRAALVVAASILAGVVVARAAESIAVRAILGAGARTVSVPAGSGASFLGDRVSAFWNTWLAPSPAGAAERGGLLLVGFLALWAAAWMAGKGRSTLAVAGAAMLGVVLYALRPLTGVADVVPGLLPACPLLAAAAGATTAAPRGDGTRRLLAVSAVVAAGAILATEYWYGGGVEWGGRFFAACLPLVVPLAVEAVARLGRRGRPVVCAVAAASAVLIVLGVVTYHAVHARTAMAMAAVDRQAAVAGGAGGGLGRLPLVLVPDPALPRYHADGFGQLQWVSTRSVAGGADQRDDILGRLSSIGVRRLVLVALGRDAPGLPPGWSVAGDRQGTPGVGVYVLVWGDGGH